MSACPPILDTFPYNGERAALYMRLKTLGPHVERFYIVEARHTFSGVPKPELYCERDADLWEPYKDKVKVLVIDAFPEVPEAWVTEEYKQHNFIAPESKESFWRERYQRQYPVAQIQQDYAHREYVLYCADVDEIPRPQTIVTLARNMYDQITSPMYLDMTFYYYSFRWAKPERWCLAFVVNNRGLEHFTLNQMRTDFPRQRFMQDAGWHCSYFMGAEDLRRKIQSFSHREFDLPAYKSDGHLVRCLREGVDLFLRGSYEDCVAAAVPEDADLPDGWREVTRELDALQLL